MRKPLLKNLFLAGLALALLVAAPSPAQTRGQDPTQDPKRKIDPGPASRKLWERVEISLTGGLGVPITRWTTLHFTESGPAAGPRVTAENRIKTTSAVDLFAGASVTFFLPSGAGIQAGFGYLKAGLESANHFEFRSVVGTAPAYTTDTLGLGELTSVPIFLCLHNKFQIPLGGKKIQAFTSIGPVIFLNSVLTETTAGAGAVVGDKADAFLIQASVADTTWAAFGATAGGGVDLRLSNSLALTLEARYYYAPRKNFAWTWTPGIYDGVFKAVTGLDFNQALAAENERNMTPLTVNPSFVQIAGGIKFIF
jgi:opacity protein-like surface antigen